MRWLTTWTWAATVAVVLLPQGGMGQTLSCVVCDGCPPGVSACTLTTDPASFDPVCQRLGCAVPCDPVSDSCKGVTGCPSTEAGQCADGVDNDANDLTDCADPACFSEPACSLKAPTLSLAGLTLVGLLLVSGGIYLVRRRETR